MKRRLLLRVAAGLAGGALALVAALPAQADSLPDGTPLNTDHKNRTADYFSRKCGAGEFNGFPHGRTPEGQSGWHFVQPGKPYFTAVYLKFKQADGTAVIVTITSGANGTVGNGKASGSDGNTYTGWIRADQRMHAYLFTPADWTLLDGTAKITGGSHGFFNVSHACAGEVLTPTTPPATPPTTPSVPTTPPTSPSVPTTAPTTPSVPTTPPTSPSVPETPSATPPSETPTPTPTGPVEPTVDPTVPAPIPPPGGDNGGGLPVTGAQVGLLATLGVALAGGGAAMLMVRRRRGLTEELLEDA